MVPPIIADEPKVLWAIDFQFDSAIDGKAIKIAAEPGGAFDHRRTCGRGTEAGVRHSRRPAEGTAPG